MKSGLQPVRITIPAGEENFVNVAAGRFFAVKEASAGEFQIALDDGAFLPWDAGMAYAVPDGGEAFQQLRIKNDSGEPIEFQIIVGAGRVYDQRLTVVAARVGDSLALDGEDAGGVSAPAGAVGIRGWLSGIYDRLKTSGPLGVILGNLETLGTSILTGVSFISGQLPGSLGAKTAAASLSVVQATSTGAIVTVQTAAVGTNFTAFASNPCRTLDVQNTTGTAIEYRRGGAGATIQIPNNTSRKIEGIANANELSVRRVDTSNTQVTLTAESIS